MPPGQLTPFCRAATGIRSKPLTNCSGTRTNVPFQRRTRLGTRSILACNGNHTTARSTCRC
jgi:hypothetical protein